MRAAAASQSGTRLLARDARRHRAEQDLARLARKGALVDPEALAIAIAVAAAATSLDD